MGCFLLSYLSCLQEEKIGFKYPRVYTNPISDITSNGARFSAKIDFLNIDQVTDFGFIWGEDSKLSGATFMILADSLTGNEFYTDVRSSLIDKKTYYVRSIVKKSGKTVYGNIVSFKSLGSEGPKITGLAPQIAAFGDTVQVIGRNFASNVTLKYGNLNISSALFKTEKSKLTFIVPGSLPINPAEDFISISIEGNITKSPLPLKLDLDRILPKIISITPLIVKACDTITIKGRNLTFEDKPVQVFDNLRNLAVIKATRESIVCILQSIPKNDISFTLSNGRFSASSQGIDLTELRPEVISVSPLIYKPKDIVTVDVKNFPYCDNSMYASFNAGSQRLQILSKTKNQIVIQLPEGCSGYFNIVFTLPANSYLNIQEFNTPMISPKPPEIYSIEPSHGSFGDEIVIKGNGLKGSGASILDTVSTSNTEIRGKLNQSAMVKDNGFTDVTIDNCGQLVMENAFTYDPVEILDFNPKVITSRSQQITITGKNFSPAPYKNTVTIGSYTTNLSSGDNRTLVVPASALMPDILQTVNESVSITIKNNVGKQVTSPTLLQINCEASWARVKDFPFAGIYLGISFSLAGKGYVGANNGNFWQYDPISDVWVQKASYPGHLDSYRVSTVANGKGYVGLGMNYNNEWYEYDPNTNAWTRRKDYPGAFAGAGFAFEIGGKVYSGGGSGSKINYEFWEYSPATDSWVRKADLPPYKTVGNVNFGFKGKGYVYATSTDGAQYENMYDPNSNRWTARRIGSFEKSANNSYMIFQDYVVVGGESIDIFRHSAFLKIIPGSGDFEIADYAGIYRAGQIGFAIGNYGYWGLGLNLSTNQGSLEVWKFDPSKFR